MSILPAVIFAAPHETEKLSKMVEYCRWLDGTELHVVRADEPEGLIYPGICNWSFKKCCKAMRGQPWLYVECDSIPIKKNWLADISKDYQRFGDGVFMWADRFNPPHDRIGGIGVAPSNADELIPDGIVDDGFDGWLLVNHPHLIKGSSLIQHSHSLNPFPYQPANWHQFPRDWDLIGENTVLFHKDRDQTLIDLMRTTSS